MCVGQRESRWCCCPLLMNMMACFISTTSNKEVPIYITFAPCMYVLVFIYWERLVTAADKIFRWKYSLKISFMFYCTFSLSLLKYTSHQVIFYLNCSIPRLLALSLTDRNIWLEKWLYKNVDIHIYITTTVSTSLRAALLFLGNTFWCVSNSKA